MPRPRPGTAWSQVIRPPDGVHQKAMRRTRTQLSLSLALLAGAALALSGLVFGPGRILALLLAGAAVLLRLPLDAARRADRSGPEAPDPKARVVDLLAEALVLVGAGYGATDVSPAIAPVIGWGAALGAIFADMLDQGARTPFSSRRRSQFLTLLIVLSLAETGFDGHGQSLAAGMSLMASLLALWVGSRLTSATGGAGT